MADCWEWKRGEGRSRHVSATHLLLAIAALCRLACCFMPTPMAPFCMLRIICCWYCCCGVKLGFMLRRMFCWCSCRMRDVCYPLRQNANPERRRARAYDAARGRGGGGGRGHTCECWTYWLIWELEPFPFCALAMSQKMQNHS